jgi:hypothetical protein
MSKKQVNEGLFGAMKKFSDAFFDGLKTNMRNQALEDAKKNKKLPKRIVNQMVELDKLSKQLKSDMEKYL